MLKICGGTSSKSSSLRSSAPLVPACMALLGKRYKADARGSLLRYIRTPAMLILTSMRRSTAARTRRTVLCFLLFRCGGLRSTGARCGRSASAPCRARTQRGAVVWFW